jgi:hypothetical protein
MRKLTTEEFITKAKQIHGDKYDYSLCKYTKSHNKIKIVCSVHGMFEQKPNNHLSGYGCNLCGNDTIKSKQRLSVDIFTEKARNVHDNKYDYSLVVYKNARSKVKILCPIHGVFEQTPTNHLSGRGCSKCSSSISNQELSFLSFIRDVYDDDIITNTKRVISPYELDVYLPDKNIAFEYNGMYWHEEGVNKPIGYHQMKTDMCVDKGITLHHIWEDDWVGNNKGIKDKVRGIIYGF